LCPVRIIDGEVVNEVLDWSPVNTIHVSLCQFTTNTTSALGITVDTTNGSLNTSLLSMLDDEKKLVEHVKK